MGDIVNSRDLDSNSRDNIKRASKVIFDRINTKYAKNLMASFGLVRGDAFEGVLLTQHDAPQIVQDIIKAFYRADKTVVRICVVLGGLTVTSSDRNETDGPAFHRALDALEEMKKSGSNHWFQVSFDICEREKPLVDSNLALLSALTERWTDKQREVVWATEENGGNQKSVGIMFGIMPSVVSRQLKVAKYDIYRQAWAALSAFLAAYGDIIEQEGESI